MSSNSKVVAIIKTYHKVGPYSGRPVQHAELVDWGPGADALPDGEHTLCLEVPPTQNQLAELELQRLRAENEALHKDLELAHEETAKTRIAGMGRVVLNERVRLSQLSVESSSPGKTIGNVSGFQIDLRWHLPFGLSFDYEEHGQTIRDLFTAQRDLRLVIVEEGGSITDGEECTNYPQYHVERRADRATIVLPAGFELGDAIEISYVGDQYAKFMTRDGHLIDCAKFAEQLAAGIREL